MASYTPPTESLPIFDNSVFQENLEGLTIAKANLLYLRKTFPDTATALETFNGGINTTTLTASGITNFLSESFHHDKIYLQETYTGNPSSRITLNPSSVGYPTVIISTIDPPTGTITQSLQLSSESIEQAVPNNSASVFTNTNMYLSVGTGGRTAFGVVHHYSDCDNAAAGAGVHLNNGLTNQSNTNIHNGASSEGEVNIGSGSLSSTAINIGNGATSTTQVNIGNGSASTSTINIGNETTTNTTNTIRGNTTITKPFMDTISATTVSSAPTLFNNITTGNMQIGQGGTSGTIAIGNNNNRTGTIGIGQNTKGNISIGNNQTAGTNTISIGTPSLGSTALKGLFVRLNDFGTGSIEFGNASTTTITLFKPLTPIYAGTYSTTTGTGSGKIVEYKKPNSNYGVGLTSGAPLSLNSFSLSAGIWLCTGNVTTGSAGAPYNALSFSLTTNVLDLTLGAMNIPAYAGYTYNLCCTYTFSFTGTTTVYLVGQVGANDTWSYPVLTATRIA